MNAQRIPQRSVGGREFVLNAENIDPNIVFLL
jgi:hypothetical protein